jgi:hypothetical protein
VFAVPRSIAMSADNKPSILPIIARINPKLLPNRNYSPTQGSALNRVRDP